MTTTTDHPTSQTLADFGHGLLDSSLHRQLEEHLNQCDVCQRYLEELPGDGFAQHFRNEAPGMASSISPARGYEILSELGRGGMGVVYQARDRRLNRLVALKKIKNGSLANREEQERFLREATLAARLVHPGIVQVYEVGEETSDDGLPIPYFAMELVEGESLAERLERGRLSEKEAMTLVETLARTIHAAHQQGVLHRDLKPANILISRHVADLGTPKIADFGLAKLLRSYGQTTSSACLSVGGVMMGTPGYMAPEQIRGVVLELDATTDVYALGAILYECLTGQTPYPKESSWSALEAVLKHDPVPPGIARPGLSAELEAICLQCLEQEPRRRYASALALADDLQRLARHEPIHARPASTTQRSIKWVRRHPWPTALLGLLILMAIGVIVGLSVHTLRLQHAIVRIEAAKARADTNYRQARLTIQNMLSRINEMKAYQHEGARQLHSKQLEDALAFNEKALQDVDADQPVVQLDTAQTLTEVATLQTTLSRHADAESSLHRALGLLDKLEGSSKEKLTTQMAAWNKLGSVQLSLGKQQLAVESYQQSQQIVKQLLLSEPDNVILKHDLAWSLHNLGAAYVGLQQREQAQEAFQLAVSLRQSLLEQDAENNQLQAMLAESQINLAMMLHQRGKRTEATRYYSQAEDTLRQLVQRVPDVLEYGVSLAALYLNKGNALGEQGKVIEALQSYREGLRLVKETLKKEPLLDRAKQLLLPLHGAAASLLDQTGRSAEALVDWEQVIALAGPQPRHYRCMRCVSLAKAKQTPILLKELEQLLSDQPLSELELWYLQSAVEAAIPMSKQPDIIAQLNRYAATIKPRSTTSRSTSAK